MGRTASSETMHGCLWQPSRLDSSAHQRVWLAAFPKSRTLSSSSPSSLCSFLIQRCKHALDASLPGSESLESAPAACGRTVWQYAPASLEVQVCLANLRCYCGNAQCVLVFVDHNRSACARMAARRSSTATKWPAAAAVAVCLLLAWSSRGSSGRGRRTRRAGGSVNAAALGSSSGTAANGSSRQLVEQQQTVGSIHPKHHHQLCHWQSAYLVSRGA